MGSGTGGTPDRRREPAGTRKPRAEIGAVREAARAEERATTAAENRLIDALEREARLAEQLAEARERSRPLRAAVADEARKRVSEIDAQLGAALRERFADKSPAELRALIDRLAEDEP